MIIIIISIIVVYYIIFMARVFSYDREIMGILPHKVFIFLWPIYLPLYFVLGLIFLPILGILKTFFNIKVRRR